MARSRATIYKRVRVDAIETKRGGGVIGYLMVVVIMPVFILGLLFVKLNSDQVKLKRELSRMRQEFALRSKELENLRIEAEMYRDGDRIRRLAGAMGLDLVETDYGQVIRMPAGVPVRAGKPASNAVVAER